jgi:hypothetical protein
MAHVGTVAEYAAPAVLLWSSGGPVTTAALVFMTVFHLFILANVPMGVPLEWNVIMIYGAWVLFGVHADVSVLSIGAPLLIVWLVGFHGVLPLVGSQWPRHVSFLLSMRYYAGNWPYNVWLFRGDSSRKLDRLVKWSAHPRQQLERLYDPLTVTALLSKVIAFRSMHIQGRALQHLVPLAVDDIEAFEWIDGEIVAGMAVGWNFGEGHLSNEELLAAVQAQCGFEAGELRVISVESQPLVGGHVAWRITDAVTGPIAAGELRVAELAEAHPWPTSRTDATWEA